MKKRILATLLTMTMVISMTACGSTDNGNADISEENIVSEVPETTNTEEVVVETETEKVDTRLEDGMAKIDRLFRAHTELLAQNKLIENTLQSDVESLNCNLAYIEYCTTKDGKTLQTYESVYNIASIYYNNYINKNGEYYDIQTWISEQENSDVIGNAIDLSSGETNTALLLEAIRVVGYLQYCDSVVGTKVIDDTSYVISGITSAYIIPLDCDGDTSLVAVFGEDGSLLNICTPEDWDKFMFLTIE